MNDSHVIALAGRVCASPLGVHVGAVMPLTSSDGAPVIWVMLRNQYGVAVSARPDSEHDTFDVMAGWFHEELGPLAFRSARHADMAIPEGMDASGEERDVTEDRIRDVLWTLSTY